IFVSMIVSLRLTPMMASRFLRAHGETRQGRFYQWSERAFDAMLRAYERGLELAMRWKFTTLMIFFATLGLSVYLFVIIPKGFFPQQDVGLITATSEAGQDISFAEMKRRQEELGKIVQADPDVATVAMVIGGSGRAGNNGNLFITLKPRNERGASAQQTNGTTLQLKINRDTASRYGIQPQLIDDTLYDAFGQRQVTQYFTQLNSYHVIIEVLPELQASLDTLNNIYVKSPTTGDQVPLSTFATWTSVPVRPLSISHQGQFPAITISFNLAQGAALGQA